MIFLTVIRSIYQKHTANLMNNSEKKSKIIYKTRTSKNIESFKHNNDIKQETRY